MRLCKYCNKPIAEKDIWNPDNDGNGYHHQCLVDMEFKARDKQIYDKGKMDVLDKIRAEIEQAADKQFQIAMGVSDLNERYAHIQMENAYRHSLNIIDKYMEGSEE